MGYSTQKFDESEAIRMIKDAFEKIDSAYAGKPKAVISGLTDIGIPALAYREAVSRTWRTVGVACSKAKEYVCFPVDEEILVGNDWGDESSAFLKSLDVLVRIGGVKQAMSETAEFCERGLPVFEYDLPAQK